MSGEVEQINWANGPGDGKKVNLVGASEQNRNVSDGIVLEVDPDIGAFRISVLIVSIADMLPSRRVVLVPHIAKNAGIEHSRRLKLEAMDGNAIDPGNHAAQAFVFLV